MMPTTVKADYFTEEQKRTARYAKALAHPVRIAILELLNSQACCYHGDMAEELPIAKSTLSQHLKELKNAGLIQGDITPPSTNIASIEQTGKRLPLYFARCLCKNF